MYWWLIDILVVFFLVVLNGIFSMAEIAIVSARKARLERWAEEELRAILEEAAEAGVIEEGEQDMVERVFRLGDRPVGVLMTPRRKIVWLDVNDSPKKIQHKILEHSFSYFPVCQGRLANIIGIARTRDLLVRSLKGQPLNLKECAEPPLFVFEGMPVVRTMELMKESSRNTAIVVDEYGGIEGLVTVDDIMKSVFGEIPSGRDSREGRIIQRHEGSWLVDGMIPLDELKDFLDIKSLPGEKAGHFQTLGGFMMSSLKRIPTTGDHFQCCGVSFEVVDMDGHRVDKVLIERSEPNGSKEGGI